MEEKAVANRLIEESVTKIFFRYLVPSLIGMMLMSVNIVIDGIFVGNVVGSVALAAVNVATPVFSAFLGISLWIGIGGGALYSMALGKDNVKQAQSVFTQSIIVVLVTVVVISIILGFNLENIAMLLGANSETLPYVKEYLTVIVTFGFIMALENSLSIFVRNDGNPNLAMVSLITMAVSNIVLNYFMIFQWELGVRGAALATIIASLLGLLILLFHFLRKDSLLRLIPVRIKFSNMKETMAVGLPSFVSEIGLAVFTIGYNVAMVSALGTVGVAAFSIVNYLHSVMLLAFMGLASAIQPMISFYYGGKHKSRIYQTVSIAEKTAVVIGAFILLIGFIEAQLFVNLFGEMGSEIEKLAVQGIRLFFIGYIFTGFNFVYMTYFQSIGSVKASMFITIMRGVMLVVLFLWLLPKFAGVVGIWLAVPVAELVVAVFVFVYLRKMVIK